MIRSCIVLVVVPVALLAACGGGGGGSGADMGAALPAVTQPQSDPFTAAVKAMAATASDDSDPQSIDAIVVTTVNDREPDPMT
jgi:hypothetical protein